MQSISCVLLNADYTPLGIISWKKAIKLICKKKVEIVKYSETVIHNFENTIVIKIPLIIKLIKLIRKLWGIRVPYSKRTVMIRDNYTCVYCGTDNKKRMTIDHIIPKSKGGKSNFDNTVCCCFDCNNKKDNRTPSESRMFLKTRPYTPTIMEFLKKSIKDSGMESTLKELELLGVL
jgi:5-methylcytosine-specific restriction endonuclease McrA